MTLAVWDHFALEIFGVVENGFAILVGQRPFVLMHKPNESFSEAHELLHFLVEFRVHISNITNSLIRRGAGKSPSGVLAPPARVPVSH